MLRTLAMLSVCAGLLAADAGLWTPTAGYVRDSAGKLRPVYGMGANFVAGEAVAGRVLAAAFSDGWGVAKADDQLLVFDREAGLVSSSSAPGGPAILALTDRGAPAAAFFPESGELLGWRGGRWHPVAAPPGVIDGPVLAVTGTRLGMLRLAVRRGDLVWRVDMSAATGRVLGETVLPGAGSPMMLTPAGKCLYVDEGELVIRDERGAETRVTLPVAVDRMAPMGDGWIHLDAGPGCAGAALDLGGGKPRIYRLPEARR